MNEYHTPPERQGRMTARELAAAFAERAEDVCRKFLPGGRREGRYWKAGNVHGDPGRSLFVGLAPSPRPGRWMDGATGESGDLLGLLRRQFGAAAFDEARAFLHRCGPVASCRPDAAVRGRPTRCGGCGICAVRSKALWRRPTFEGGASRRVPSRRCGSIRRSSTATERIRCSSGHCRRWWPG